jgi:hypothetical protein
VTVLGAGGQLSALLTQVTGVGPGRSLAAKVRTAQSALAAGDTALAASKLADLISETQAQRGKKIPVATADAIIAAARQIIAVLGT